MALVDGKPAAGCDRYRADDSGTCVYDSYIYRLHTWRAGGSDRCDHRHLSPGIFLCGSERSTPAAHPKFGDRWSVPGWCERGVTFIDGGGYLATRTVRGR